METTEAPPLTEADIEAMMATLAGDNLACEANHATNGNPCSITVTHRERLTCCGVVKNVCAAEAEDTLARPDTVCDRCGRTLAVCWIVNPI